MDLPARRRVDTEINRVAAKQRQNWTLLMEQQVAEADCILVVASPGNKRQVSADADTSKHQGVQDEAPVIRNLIYQHHSDLQRPRPSVLPDSTEDVPEFPTPGIATVARARCAGRS